MIPKICYFYRRIHHDETILQHFNYRKVNDDSMATNIHVCSIFNNVQHSRTFHLEIKFCPILLHFKTFKKFQMSCVKLKNLRRNRTYDFIILSRNDEHFVKFFIYPIRVLTIREICSTTSFNCTSFDQLSLFNLKCENIIGWRLIYFKMKLHYYTFMISSDIIQFLLVMKSTHLTQIWTF